MHNPTNLDDYLAGLGISDADDDTSSPNPLAATATAAPQCPNSLQPRQNSDLSPSSQTKPDCQASRQAQPADAQAALEQFLRGVAERFGGPHLTVRVRRDGDHLEGEILGDDVGRLIGREGHVIEALDILAYAVVAKHLPEGEHLRVQIDVGGYRDRHFQTLRQVAARVAQQVASSGEGHTFQPMNPADRRIIHMTLKDNPHVVTHSVGEGGSRRLVVTPAPAR